jgi:hypothetical protein
MPNAWTYAKVYSLSMTLVNGTTGVIFRILLGQGDPPI